MEALKKLFNKIAEMDLYLIVKTFAEICLFTFAVIILKVALQIIGIWGLLIFAAASIYSWNMAKRIFKAALEILDKLID